MSIKSELVVDIELLLKKIKRRSRFLICKIIRKACPTTLRNFDKKYPHLGKFKNDVNRMGVLLLVRVTFLFAALPVISLFIVTNYTVTKISKLFKRKGK